MVMKGLIEEVRNFVEKVLLLFSWESRDNYKAVASIL